MDKTPRDFRPPIKPAETPRLFVFLHNAPANPRIGRVVAPSASADDVSFESFSNEKIVVCDVKQLLELHVHTVAGLLIPRVEKAISLS